MTEQYLVSVQKKYQEKSGEWYNLARLVGGIGKTYFRTLECAKSALEKYIADNNNGARTETTKCGSIGIDFVLDEETANEQRVIHWKIEKRLVTPFELVEEA